MDELEAILETGGVAAVEVAAAALAERGAPTVLCPNCAKPMLGPYCAICGQPLNTHRRKLGHLLHELVKDIVSFDSRILRTCRALLLEPGELPKAFREGRTQRYMPAVRLYLFVSLLFFLFLSATGIAFMQFSASIVSVKLTHDSAGRVLMLKNGKTTVLPHLKSDAKGNVFVDKPNGPPVPDMKANGDVNATIATEPVFFRRAGTVKFSLPTEVQQEIEKANAKALKEKESDAWVSRAFYGTVLKLQTDPGALNGPLMTWIPRILFFLLPVYALLLAVFYWGKRKQFFFVDHLVFSLTQHTFLFVVLICAAAVAQIFSGSWLAAVVMAVLSLYTFLSLKFFYGQGWWRTGLKFIGITSIYGAFFLFPALAVAIAASVLQG
jgi:hypothetical protein